MTQFAESTSSDDRPVFESLTCAIACLVLIPASLKSRRRPPLSPSFTCWKPTEICWRADENKFKPSETLNEPHAIILRTYDRQRKCFRDRHKSPALQLTLFIEIVYDTYFKSLSQEKKGITEITWRKKQNMWWLYVTISRKGSWSTSLPPSTDQLSLCGRGSGGGGWCSLLSLALQKENKQEKETVRSF